MNMENTIRVIHDINDYPAYKTEFQFDWKKVLRDNPDAILLGYFVNDRLSGLIAFTRNVASLFNFVHDIEVSSKSQGHHIGAQLLAQVMVDAFQQPDFDGYVELTAKTNGVEKFYAHLNGIFLTTQTVMFTSEISQAIITNYLPEGGLLDDRN